MKFTEERLQQMLSIIGEKLAPFVRASDLFLIWNGQETWSHYFRYFDETAIFEHIIGNGNDQIFETEFDEIIRPHIPGILAKALGAEKVIIEWPDESSKESEQKESSEEAKEE